MESTNRAARIYFERDRTRNGGERKATTVSTTPPGRRSTDEIQYNTPRVDELHGVRSSGTEKKISSDNDNKEYLRAVRTCGLLSSGVEVQECK